MNYNVLMGTVSPRGQKTRMMGLPSRERSLTISSANPPTWQTDRRTNGRSPGDSMEILLWKLYNYGTRGHIFEWFKSYLSNRRQYASVNGYESEELLIKYGIPQGSVWGPLLFLIYINDLLMQFQVIKLYYSPMTQIYLYLTNHFMKWLLKQMSSWTKLRTGYVQINSI